MLTFHSSRQSRQLQTPYSPQVTPDSLFKLFIPQYTHHYLWERFLCRTWDNFWKKKRTEQLITFVIWLFISCFYLLVPDVLLVCSRFSLLVCGFKLLTFGSWLLSSRFWIRATFFLVSVFYNQDSCLCHLSSFWFRSYDIWFQDFGFWSLTSRFYILVSSCCLMASVFFFFRLKLEGSSSGFINFGFWFLVFGFSFLDLDFWFCQLVSGFTFHALTFCILTYASYSVASIFWFLDFHFSLLASNS